MKKIILSLVILFLMSTRLLAQANTNVRIVGEMRNVMWKGQLYGNINLDTIANKQHLYGLWPVAYLSGELMILDGKSYKATALSPTTMKVEETFEAKAPFFGYCNINKWTTQNLPDSVQTISQLETYLDRITKSAKRPFMFKMNGEVETAKIHVVNLPKGSKVSSPEEAHKGQVNFDIENQQVAIVGFFSTEHKTIFTHHDTFLHLHLMTFDNSKMGHLDEVKLKKGSVLYLPVD
jgi:acetolactate decarboxylase